MTHARWRAALLGALLTLSVGCATSGWRERPGTAGARFDFYRDDQGLTVYTVGATAEQPVSREVSVIASSLVDHIVVTSPEHVHEDTGGQPTGHHHPDTVTGASATVLGGEVVTLTRVEGTVGAAAEVDIAGAPTRFEATGRVSYEDDYLSSSGRLRATTELFSRNTTLGTSFGYGHDIVDPIEAPPGEIEEWPASHDRINGGVTLHQLLSPRLAIAGGASFNYQWGRLSNPYRRAVVRTSLFPEALPDDRTRVTAFIGLSLYLDLDFALHARQGVYADTWGVLAAIPEVALSKGFADRVVVTARYRFYRQGGASFYAPVYEDLLDIRSSDARLGSIENHVPAIDGAFTLVGRRDASGSLTLGVTYSPSFLEYREVQIDSVAHNASLWLSGAY